MELRLPAPCLIVLVGPSASGKSTWAAEHFAANEVVSSDALRAIVGSGEDDQAAGTSAFELLELIVAERMRRRLTTVIDTLGMDSERRSRWVALAREHQIPTYAMVFDADLEVCEARNDQRERPMPKTVLRKQVSRFNKVKEQLEGEDFDDVYTEQPAAAVAVAIPGEQDDIEPARGAVPSSGHTFGLLVSRFDWDNEMGPTLASIARRAEAAGFRDIWVMDHFRQVRGVGRPWEDLPEAYAALGMIAGVTSSIRLGALVSGVTHRHPVVLGKTLASLDVLSGGRIVCGLGIAWDSAEHEAYGIDFPPVSARYEILEETVQMLPLLWGKGTPEFHGTHIDASELICYPRPLQDPIPILIGGSGEKRTLRLVAQYADACNLFGDPDRVRHKVEVLHEHCADVERDASDIEVTHLTNALAAPDRKELRTRVDALRGRNTSAEEFMKRHKAGTVEDLEVLFSQYAEAGTTHSIVALPDLATDGSIESFGELITRFNG